MHFRQQPFLCFSLFHMHITKLPQSKIFPAASYHLIYNHDASQTCAVLSQELEAMRLPSGDHTTDSTERE